MNHDIVIKNSRVIRFDPDTIDEGCNVGISNGKIVTLSHVDISGDTVIDGGGKILSPGFIDFHSHVDGKEFSAEIMLRQGATTTIGGERRFDGKTIRNITNHGFLINHGFFVSHSFTIRQTAGIIDPYRKATKKEIDYMCMFAEQFLENGSFGIHFGLEFVPGTTTEEVIRLAEVSKKYDRTIVIHLRKDGTEGLESLDEVIEIAKKSGARVHILHLLYMVGYKGVMEAALKKIDEAREMGLDITADTGLYPAFPSCIGSSILDGDWENHYANRITEREIMISSGVYAGQFCDKDMFTFLRAEFPNTLVTVFACDEEVIEQALIKPYVYVSTNGADGPHYENIGHPETAGTFPRLISKYVKEKKLLSLTEAIKKITYYPAKRFDIRKKGIIEKGYDADIVLFDYDSFEDISNYVGYGNPNASPKGLSHVIINGNLVFDDGKIISPRNMGTHIYAQSADIFISG